MFGCRPRHSKYTIHGTNYLYRVTSAQFLLAESVEQASTKEARCRSENRRLQQNGDRMIRFCRQRPLKSHVCALP